MTKRLSVVVITWNEKGRLKTCLQSLMPAIDPARDEVVLVDNGSVDGTEEMIRAEYPSIRYFRLDRNIGVGPARNRGMWLAEGEYLMILDNDTEILNVSFPQVIEEAFTANPKLGLLAFRLENPDGTTQHNTRRLPTVINPFIARLGPLRKIPFLRRMLERHLMDDVDLDAQTAPLEVDYVLGANQVFRKETAVRLNGYDDRIFFGPEDCDFCMRVHDLGLQVQYFNTISIRHEYQRRTRKFNLLTLRHIYGFYWLFWKRRCLFVLR